jgi:hypothetical protein
MSEFSLQDIPLTAEEKDKISQLGADTPVALLGIIKAAHQAFENYFGKERSAEIENIIRESISEREQAIIDAPSTKFSTGAIVDR